MKELCKAYHYNDGYFCAYNVYILERNGKFYSETRFFKRDEDAWSRLSKWQKLKVTFGGRSPHPVAKYMHGEVHAIEKEEALKLLTRGGYSTDEAAGLVGL